MPPTILYNEGWMLRLVLDAFSRVTQSTLPLKPAPNAIWCSEVLLPSRFLARSRGDLLAEGWTHADAVIGHFTLKPGGRGDINLSPDATQLVVVEAKMFSPLSAGTTRAPSFNQAARNVACMAHVVAEAQVPLDRLTEFSFVVLAPEQQLALSEFGDLVHKDSIARVVSDRVAAYSGHFDSWHRDAYAPAHERINVRPISWESAIAEIAKHDRDYGVELEQFYAQCIRFNQPTAMRSRQNQPSV